jgi:hypothetical protein
LLAVLLGTLGGGVFGYFGLGGGLGEFFVTGIVESGTETDVYREALAGATFIYAADRRYVAVVAAVGDADMAKFDRFAESGIEAEPAAAWQENFRPRVRSLASDDFFLFGPLCGIATYQITGDIASR